MTRRAAIALLVAMAGVPAGAAPAVTAPAPAAVPSPADFTGDKFEADLDTGESIFRGHCRYRSGPVLITADEMRLNSRTNLIVAIGHATLTRGDERLLADRLDFDQGRGTFAAVHIRVGRYPFYIQGDSAEGSKKEVIIHHASITYTDPGRWKPSLKAETIVYSPGHYLRTVRSLVGLHREELVPLGAVSQNLASTLAFPYLSLEVGRRSGEGGTADLGLRLPVVPGVKLGGDLGIFTSRGAMIGPSADYFDPNFDPKNEGGRISDLVGSLRSGWISDYGERLPDVLGNTVPRNREYVTWKHQQKLSDHVTLNGEVNWWSDSDVIRDFDPKRFYQNQNPDSYLEPVYRGDNYFASVFARFRPNTWEAVQERLPEFSYNLLPDALGGGIYQRLESSAAYLREDLPFSPAGIRAVGIGSDVEYRYVGGITGPDLAETRVDTFYELSRPWSPNDWFNLTPVAGGRITDYSSTVGAPQPGGYLRALGEVGFDSQLRSSGTYDYQNPVWDIDGVRHLLTPIVSYRYIPDADKGQNFIPEIDRQTFNTYLPPLDLGDVRYLDQLQSENTLRLGVDNTIQTRADGYGSRDLFTLNFADDLHFQRNAAEPDFSDLHTDLAITPAQWLEFDATEVVSPETWQLREFTSGLLLHDGNQWHLRLGNDFVRHENDNYIMEYGVRLNECYDATILAEYDARIHVVNRVAIGVTETIANTWRIQYLLVRNGGPNRDGPIRFETQVEVLRF